MRTFIAVLALVAACTARNALPASSGFQNSDSLESVNAQVMERLRQEVGSERGVYHVYLPDGRLQRVQYTAAPVRTGQQDQASSGGSSSAQEDQSVRASPNAYYVQVPSGRLEQLQTYPSANLPTYQQQQQVASEGFQARNNQFLPLQVVTPEQLARYTSQQLSQQVRRRDAVSQPLQVRSEFVPLQVVTVDQLPQYNAD